ncbi:class I mannose-6-phosphate isomerase [Bacillus cytotoxicus]|uniref:Class I mannose-6-phosphate isomerase n=1 Tax=Bacillus cytotoxicus TaxID=580165 RepID=A0ACC6AA12_9BACI|nr:class I mannose-6-phosphate isomerase [Bacillus cytotoxicus]
MYNKFPEIRIKGPLINEVWQGYDSIQKELSHQLSNNENMKTVVIDCYPGVRYDEIKTKLIDGLGANLVVFSDDLAYSGEEITTLIERNLTDDRVFGVLSCHTLEEFFDMNKIQDARKKIEDHDGVVVVYGVGASLVTKGDILIYADLARWEIQQRYRSKELGNWKIDNHDEDILRKYKRGFFVEWRVSDRHKKTLYNDMNYYLDTNEKDNAKMVSGRAFLEGMRQTINQPFRLVPYFDPGVWGGQWMKDVCGLDKEKENFAWSFDGVPEENSLYLTFGDVRIETPSINTVFLHPTDLLGDRVHARFGTEFPIRFDFLDTISGQNLSLQVHPLVEYIQEKFGMHYTQDESYYILDSKENADVYLGLKHDVNPEEMMEDLRRAERGEISFPDEKYINKFPVKKHDHFLIPAGTIHCSGTDTMVLEISSTPYIFTFKLWDWDRLGLDGLPRPVHIDHGEKNIVWNRDTKWVEANLINRIETIASGDGWREERTGLHEREFIETRRHWFTSTVHHNTNGSVNMLNLIEGEEAIVESPTNKFEPFIVRYAETFIIPECVEEYTIKPYGKSKGKEIATIKAFVRI